MSHPKRTVDDPSLDQAIRVIESKWGDRVSVDSKASGASIDVGGAMSGYLAIVV